MNLENKLTRWQMAANQIVFPATLHVLSWLVVRENTTWTLGPGLYRLFALLHHSPYPFRRNFFIYVQYYNIPLQIKLLS